jgi:hypothetical protein
MMETISETHLVIHQVSGQLMVHNLGHQHQALKIQPPPPPPQQQQQLLLLKLLPPELPLLASALIIPSLTLLSPSIPCFLMRNNLNLLLNMTPRNGEIAGSNPPGGANPQAGESPTAGKNQRLIIRNGKETPPNGGKPPREILGEQARLVRA